MKISIVGGGATGTTVLSHLSEAVGANRPDINITDIYIYDKCAFDGGVAYRTESDDHLLNMRISTMSAKAGDADHLVRWLRGVGVPCDGNDHLPRKSFRTYLDYLRKMAVYRCRHAGIKVHQISDEVTRVRVRPDQDFLLETRNTATFSSSILILCTGHNEPDDHYELIGCKNYVHDPYAPMEFSGRTGVEAGIIGTGLTAVDIAISLARNPEVAGVHCFSRSGLFPKVQPCAPVKLNELFRAHLLAYVQSSKHIRADDYVRRVEHALLNFAGISVDLSRYDVRADGLTDLKRNIEEAKSGQPNVYSYLSRISDVMCDAWNKMSKGEKRRFLNTHYSGWMRNRHAMPLVNAQKLLDIAHTQKLSMASGLRNIVKTGDRFRATFAGGDSRDIDYVVAATGPSYKIQSSLLYSSLNEQGLIRIDEFGGVSCDYVDGAVYDEHGQKRRDIYAVGPITRGTHIYAAAVHINLERTESAVSSILRAAERVDAPVAVAVAVWNGGSARISHRTDDTEGAARSPISTLSQRRHDMSVSRTEIGELERLADRVRSEDPSLQAVVLEPNGKYQTRTLALDALTREVTQRLAQGFGGLGPEQFPTLYCAWGKCRVGSTALTNLFGVAGLPSYYQPVKTIARHRLLGGEGAPWLLPARTAHPQIFSKEMGGPYVLAECLYIPLQPLIEAGYPPDKLHLVLLDRDPSRSLASWLNKWSDRVPENTLIRNYVISALNAVRVKGYARRHGVPVTHYVYEASKEAVQSVLALFNRLGLSHRFTEGVVTDWKDMGQLESEKAQIIYPDEPAVYHVPGLHGSDTAYKYRDRAMRSLSETQIEMLAHSGVVEVYNASVAGCVADLGLNAAASQRLFGLAA